MRVPLVKEHGAWFVLVFSCAAGILSGWSIRGHEAILNFVLTSAGLALLINSKAPLLSLIRGRRLDKAALAWTVIFLVSGLLLLWPFLERVPVYFVMFSPVVIFYLFLIAVKKEHLLIAELTGFSLLTMAAPILFFMATGALSLKLYAAVLLFFCAGVFKVRMRMRKTVFFRVVMAVYCFFVLVVFYYLDIDVLILFPLLENITNAIWFRDEKLKVTGNVELVKGVLFLILFGLYFV